MRRHKKYNPEFEQRVAIQLQTIGQRFYDLRKARNRSLKTVAKATKMAPATLSKMEKGLYDFKLLHLFRLCKYYRVKVMDIVK